MIFATNAFEQLYFILSEEVNHDPEYRKHRQATQGASLALLDELEQRCGEDCRELLDMKLLMDAQGQQLHEQALFRAAVRLGVELGRMGE